MTDDLSAPLGLNKPARRSRKLTFAQLHLVAGASGLSMLFLTGWMFLADKPVTRGPVAAAHLQAPQSTTAPAPEPSLRVIRLSPDDRGDAVMVEHPAVAAPPKRTITIIDGTSGRRQEIEIPDDVADTSSVEPAPVVEPRKPASAPRGSTSNGSRSPDLNARTAKRNTGKPDAASGVRASGVD